MITCNLVNYLGKQTRLWTKMVTVLKETKLEMYRTYCKVYHFCFFLFHMMKFDIRSILDLLTFLYLPALGYQC